MISRSQRSSWYVPHLNVWRVWMVIWVFVKLWQCVCNSALQRTRPWRPSDNEEQDFQSGFGFPMLSDGLAFPRGHFHSSSFTWRSALCFTSHSLTHTDGRFPNNSTFWLSSDIYPMPSTSARLLRSALWDVLIEDVFLYNRSCPHLDSQFDIVFIRHLSLLDSSVNIGCFGLIICLILIFYFLIMSLERYLANIHFQPIYTRSTKRGQWKVISIQFYSSTQFTHTHARARNIYIYIYIVNI